MKQKIKVRFVNNQPITYRLLSIILFVLLISSMHIYAENKQKELSKIEKTAQSINQILDIKANDKTIKLPRVPKGYKIILKGEVLFD